KRKYLRQRKRNSTQTHPLKTNFVLFLEPPNTKKTGVSTGQVVGFWLNVLTISNLFFKDNDLEKTIQEISSQNSF
ncbi:hypothetical protein LEP1GSC038_0038, partial [Leptospira weilii str. 2006001855]